MTELHVKYAPILRFNQSEQFFPMRLDDMLAYSGLYAKDQSEPIVPRGQVTSSHLSEYGRSSQMFVRSVATGPLFGRDVVAQWGEGALEMVYRGAAVRPAHLAKRLARRAYNWLSPKNEDAAQLFWWNSLVSHVLEGSVQSVSRNELPRLVLPHETQRNAVERYRSSYGRSPAHTYYYRQARDGSYLCLQYWFFYSYNDWGRSFAGMNDHEGDWECLMLFFRPDGAGRPQEPPAYVTFADHESRQTKPWEHEDVARIGTHPVGFVAAGSHATYPQASMWPLMKLYNLFDYATGDGVTIDHDEWVHRLDLHDVPWLGDYKGSWGTRFWLPIAQAKTVMQVMLAGTPLRGLLELAAPSEIELPGVSAPHGPVGRHRPQYANPVAWAGVPDE